MVEWFRVHHWDVVAIVICLSLAIAVIWGDRLDVTAVKVNGNRDLSTEQLSEIIFTQAEGRTLWVLPQSNILLFDLDQLRGTLEKKYAFEDLRLTREFPNQIHVTLKEKILGVTWIAKDRTFYLDLKGIISQEVDDRMVPNIRYPKFHEANQPELSVNQRALTKQMVNAILEIQERWPRWSKGSIDYFTTPKITCAETVEQRTVIPIDYPTNETEREMLTQQGNVLLDDVQKTASVVRTEKIEKEIPCKSYDHITELHVVTTDGWKVLFDTQESLEDQFKSLALALREVENLVSIDYFDLRTPTRVYYQ
jgi:hypothetical protein